MKLFCISKILVSKLQIVDKLSTITFVSYSSFFLVFAIFFESFAQTTSEEAQVPDLKVFFFQDNSNVLNIQEVSSASFATQFQESSSDRLNFGLSTASYWLKLLVRKKEDNDQLWRLEVDYPPLDSVLLYTSTQEGTWKVQKGGEKISRAQRNIQYRKPIFNIDLPDTLWHTYYLKVRTLGTVQIPLELHSSDNLQTTLIHSEFREGLFFGAMFLMILYNLFLFFSLKEKSYLYYSLFVTCNAFVLAGLQGFLSYHFFSPDGWYDQIFVSSVFAVCFWSIIFAISILRIQYYAPRVYLILVGLAVIAGINFMLAYFLPYHLSIKVVVFLIIIVPFVLCWSGVTAWWRGRTTARFFVLGWAVYLVSSILIGLRNFGWISAQVNLENIAQIGAALETLLLSLTMADRINVYRSETVKAQQQELKASLENERITLNQNRDLEKRIVERTQEISYQNEELSRQQEIIKELNEQLILYSEDLEHEVNKRTNELTKANKRLLQQNNRLEQFAFIASHKLRGPIAQILGVINIFDLTDLSEYNHLCIGHLEKSAIQLDTVIGDINDTIVFQENVEGQFKMISLYTILLGVLEKYQKIIKDEKIQIHNQVSPEVQVYAIERYCKNVLDQLISNAIKYRSKLRPLEICFSSQKVGSQMILTISDNGMGINMEKYKEKVFGLYQKFHLHKEGKGIGLYLVKSQIETMGGQIEIISTEKQGTTFRIYLNTSNSPEKIFLAEAQKNYKK